MTARAYCGSCRRPILWATSERGRSLPLDWEPVADGSVVPVAGSFVGGDRRARVLGKDEQPPADVARYWTHWETCPNSDQHRRRR